MALDPIIWHGIESIDKEFKVASKRAGLAKKHLVYMKLEEDMYEEPIKIIKNIVARMAGLYRKNDVRKALLDRWEKNRVLPPEQMLSPEDLNDLGDQILKVEDEMIVLCLRVAKGFYKLREEIGGVEIEDDR